MTPQDKNVTPLTQKSWQLRHLHLPTLFLFSIRTSIELGLNVVIWGGNLILKTLLYAVKYEVKIWDTVYTQLTPRDNSYLQSKSKKVRFIEGKISNTEMA